MSIAIDSPHRRTRPNRASTLANRFVAHGRVWSDTIKTVISVALAGLVAVVSAWILVDVAKEAVSQIGVLAPFDLVQFVAGRR